jgi:hypothetical protein
MYILFIFFFFAHVSRQITQKNELLFYFIRKTKSRQSGFESTASLGSISIHPASQSIATQ